MTVYLGINNDGTFVSSDGYVLQDSNGLSLSATPMVSRWKVILNGVVYRMNINTNLKDGE